MNCNQCENNCIIKDIYTTNERICSGCNLGVISKCSCSYYTVHTQEIWCEHCNIQLKSCSHCKKLFNILNINNDHCSQCFEEIKNNDPSTKNEVYEFRENFVKWVLIKKRCVLCDMLVELKKYENMICENCRIDIEFDLLVEQYKNIEFKIIESSFYGKSIKGRLLCKCGEYTEWISKYYLFNYYNFIVLQCKNCNPSTKFIKYEYTSNVWNLEKIGQNCNLCNNILWKRKREKWGNIIQCKVHQPTSKFIKYIYTDAGYKIDKIKVLYDNKRHYWVGACSETTSNDYKCECDKCNKI